MNTCNGKNPLILVTENSEILLFSINGMTSNGGGIATFMRSKVDYLDQVIDLIEQPIKSTDCILYLLSSLIFFFSSEWQLFSFSFYFSPFPFI